MSIHFSIIVPCYNVEKTVVRTLDTIKNQTYLNYEVIAVNDGSNDNTADVLNNYMNRNNIDFKVIRQVNKGLGAARNSGIRAAKYDIVAFLDADDLWHPDKLRRVCEAFEKRADVDLVCHDEDVVKNGKKIRQNVYGPYSTYEDLLFKGNCLSGSAVAVKKEKLFEVGLFSEDLTFHGVEDYDLWMKLARKKAKFYYLHEILGEYVLHEDNMTSQVQSFFNRSWTLLNHHLENYPQKGLMYRIKRRYTYGIAFRGHSRTFLWENDFASARHYSFMAIRQNPFSVKSLIVLCASIIKHKI